ncbi:hypothetical protein [Stappia indica]|uniref:Uncharacterized protein n=1 Tax=Stappia indica TaxID=538381 RepID=A0A857C4E5_9HYPH|nr:hypothetical protein [Stappia indica]QGZ33916.1 hypothetical protein GH266_04965 [Stappia indica]
MELAVAAIAQVGSALGLGASGTAAATAGAATGAASGFGSTALSVLQGVGTAAGILGQLGGASESAALQADIQAGQEKVQGTQAETRMKQELLRILGENQVATAAAGIDITAGIGQQANQTAKRRAASELSISRENSDMQSALYRLRANGLRTRARGERFGGLVGAFGTGAQFGIDLAARG